MRKGPVYGLVLLLCVLAVLVFSAESVRADLDLFESSIEGQILSPDLQVVPDEPFDQAPVKVNDPIEKVNRFMFQVNDKFYFYGLKPVSKIYAAYFPPGIREGVRNGFTNILMPVRVVNNALQGKFRNSGVELARFTINSTLGIAGMVDVAARDFDLRAHNEDLGQTFGWYGAGPGFYIVFPLLGPTDARDLVGTVGDSFLNPLTYISSEWYVSAAVAAGREINNASLREGEYEKFKQMTLDPYAAMRHGYLQNREKQIRE